MPPVARDLLNSKEAGKFIPILVMTTADGEKGVGAVAYERLKDDARKAAREMRRRFSDLAKESDEEPEETAEPQLVAEEQEWTNLQGKTIRAAVVKIDDAKVQFLINKKTVEYPLDKLSEQSRNQLKELAD